jgi:HEPN domain-containing protein
MNKAYAQEWLLFAKKNLDTAIKLYEVKHYTDIIGVELQQALEKMLKALFAYNDKKIKKTHKLLELIAEIEEIEFSLEEIRLLETATNYYRVDRYPNPNYFLPSEDEIAQIIKFSKKLFDEICFIINPDQNGFAC